MVSRFSAKADFSTLRIHPAGSCAAASGARAASARAAKAGDTTPKNRFRPFIFRFSLSVYLEKYP
jgi:hypothetical protein